MAIVSMVEDNPDNRLLVHALLGKFYELNEYVDGAEALVGLKVNKPDLILMDISLPKMDGSEVLKNIRADKDLKAVPVIALTAHAIQGDRERFLDQGFDGYVSKPIVDEQLLIEMIESLLHRNDA